MIIVVDDEDRENEGDFLALADYATPETINFMAKEGRGLICAPLTEEIAHRLNLHPMVENNTDVKETAFTVTIDHKDTTTGISAFERALTIEKLVDSNSVACRFQSSRSYFSAHCEKRWCFKTEQDIQRQLSILLDLSVLIQLELFVKL